MNTLIFKRRKGPCTEVIVSIRQSPCVPRAGEFVCLNLDDASEIVLRVEYIITLEKPEVWVWVE